MPRQLDEPTLLPQEDSASREEVLREDTREEVASRADTSWGRIAVAYLRLQCLASFAGAVLHWVKSRRVLGAPWAASPKAKAKAAANARASAQAHAASSANGR